MDVMSENKVRKPVDYMIELVVEAEKEKKDRICLDLKIAKDMIQRDITLAAYLHQAGMALNMGVETPRQVRGCEK